MGNSDPSQASADRATADQVMANYKQLRHENNGLVLSDQQEEHIFFLKEFNFGNKVEFKKALAKYEEVKQNSGNENLLNLVKLSSREFNNFCSDSYKIYAVYEYSSVNLEDEINARTKEQKHFEEEELWSILQSCANALSELKATICLHPRNVFVVPDGVLKVICNDMIEQDYRCVLKEEYYYAPEKIEGFNRLDNENSLRKQTIFNLGMTVLHAALLEPLYSCYNYEKFSFLEAQLEQFIEKLVHFGYSEDFIEIIAMIVEPNPNKRASLMEVHGMLTKMWNTETEDKSEEQQEGSHLETGSQQKQPGALLVDKKQLTLHPCSSDKSFPTSFNSYSQPPPYPPANKQNLFTDPKLLQMIRRDLHELGELKRSSMINAFAPYDHYTGPSLYPRSSHEASSSLTLGNNAADGCRGPQEGLRLKQRDTNLGHSCGNTQKQEEKSRGFTKNSQTPAVYVVEQYEDGRKYQGNVVCGLRQGYGKLIYSDGAYFQGQFIDGKMEGHGTLFYEPGKPAYEGEWRQDQFYGFGTLYNQNPIELNGSFNYNDFNNIENFWVKYEGDFKKDDKSGEGVLLLSNGEEFRGHFEGDFINGEGVFCTCDRQEVRGVWKENVLVEMHE